MNKSPGHRFLPCKFDRMRHGTSIIAGQSDHLPDKGSTVEALSTLEKILGGDKDRPYVTVLGARNSRLR